jgi:hypothetical protein
LIHIKVRNWRVDIMALYKRQGGELCIGLSRGMSAEQTNSRLAMPAGCSAIFCGQPAAWLALENAMRRHPRELPIGRPRVQP